jgi:hypothetical protein
MIAQRLGSKIKQQLKSDHEAVLKRFCCDFKYRAILSTERLRRDCAAILQRYRYDWAAIA